jgi:hypothetical protein
MIVVASKWGKCSRNQSIQECRVLSEQAATAYLGTLKGVTLCTIVGPFPGVFVLTIHIRSQEHGYIPILSMMDLFIHIRVYRVEVVALCKNLSTPAIVICMILHTRLVVI